MARNSPLFLAETKVNEGQAMSTTGNGIALLIRGRRVLVDEEDVSKVEGLPWTFFDNRRGHVYAQLNVKRPNGKWERVRMHRMLVGASAGDGSVVDHINGDTLDNRKANLRVVTATENNQNKVRRKNGGPFKSGNGWVVRRMHNSKNEYHGFFKDYAEALAVFNRVFGEAHVG
jgi:hypothetical protein